VILQPTTQIWGGQATQRDFTDQSYSTGATNYLGAVVGLSAYDINFHDLVEHKLWRWDIGAVSPSSASLISWNQSTQTLSLASAALLGNVLNHTDTAELFYYQFGRIDGFINSQ
jgi:hypothetical protein